jgi:lipoprotein-anchoring transpeptidase ErfK/SrfK
MSARLSAGLIAVGLLVTSSAAFAWSPFDPEDRYQRGYSGYQRGYEGGSPFSRGYGGSSGGGRGVTSAPGRYSPGTIVIKTGERRLYLMQSNGQAISYAIGVGRAGFAWSGVKRITAKKEWPSWTPPAQMLKRRPDLPRHMVGGINNPLGARALYLGSSLYRIHGSNEPETIGQAVSSGCFRMTNEDVADLYNRVRVGTTVVVQH